MATPRASGHRSVWLVAPEADGTPRHTSIHHSTLDCPVIRAWIDTSPSEAQLVEVDRQSGQALAEWEVPWLIPGESRDELGSDWSDYSSNQHFDLTDWRACLRCGTPTVPELRVCGRCHLTPCECE